MRNYFKNLYNFIITDIKGVMVYIPFGLLAFLCLFLMLYLIGCMTDNSLRKKRSVLYSFLGSYSIVTLIITFLSRESGTREGLELKLLSTVGNGPRNDAYVVENVLLFIPFGILLPICYKKLHALWKVGAIGFVISLCIEAGQYATKRGYAQLDDLVTNTLGAVIGYCIFFIAYNIVIRKKPHSI